MSTVDTSTEQTVEWDELQTVDWDDVPHRLRDPWPFWSTQLRCEWVRDEANDERLISVWYRGPR
jgi:hypothetical protein